MVRVRVGAIPWLWRWQLLNVFRSFHRPFPVRYNGSVFARKMHSTTEFTMTILSKSVCVCVRMCVCLSVSVSVSVPVPVSVCLSRRGVRRPESGTLQSFPRALPSGKYWEVAIADSHGTFEIMGWSTWIYLEIWATQRQKMQGRRPASSGPKCSTHFWLDMLDHLVDLGPGAVWFVQSSMCSEMSWS